MALTGRDVDDRDPKEAAVPAEGDARGVRPGAVDHRAGADAVARDERDRAARRDLVHRGEELELLPGELGDLDRERQDLSGERAEQQRHDVRAEVHLGTFSGRVRRQFFG
ncbi:MAG: hypothetical protein B7Z66_15115 [Chromatiales bacterium 21-64-14]|nr:MAG: hypothetical protein B7Z66_15115 [Chromatiales bacterium 21-64-14]